jgi:hypothetical protein
MLVGCGVETGCVADWSVDPNITYTQLFDMSGNAEEWTDTPRIIGQPPDEITLYEIRGGSYNDQGGGLTCGFDFWAAEPDLTMPNLGFRCCRGAEPIIPDPCQDAIDLLANHPFDFEGCSADGWGLTGDWEVGLSSNPAPHNNSGCDIATDLDDDYSNGSDSQATSPTLDLSACDGETVTLNWFMWLRQRSGDYPSLDIFHDGAWDNDIQEYRGSDENWTEYSVNISNYLTNDFRIRFWFTSNGWQTRPGVYIDDISIQKP